MDCTGTFIDFTDTPVHRNALILGDGGKLVIGVDKNNEVVGLEGDCSTLQDGGDRDEFELHLRNLINRQWGVEFAASNLSIDFEQIGDDEVCVIDVKRGSSPLFLKTKDKHGTPIEKFFTRSGNSSPPITNPSEIAAYIQKRFG